MNDAVAVCNYCIQYCTVKRQSQLLTRRLHAVIGCMLQLQMLLMGRISPGEKRSDGAEWVTGISLLLRHSAAGGREASDRGIGVGCSC